MKLLLFGLCVFASACSDSVSGKSVVGNYAVMVSQNGKSDPDIMTILTGSDGVLLITFIAGISTDADGPNASGLRATLAEGYTLKLAKQPAHIEHSTGLLNGNIWGDGKVTGMDINLIFHYLPTNFAIGQQQDPDGGVVLTRPDMGTTQTLDYQVTGSKQI